MVRGMQCGKMYENRLRITKVRAFPAALVQHTVISRLVPRIALRLVVTYMHLINRWLQVSDLPFFQVCLCDHVICSLNMFTSVFCPCPINRRRMSQWVGGWGWGWGGGAE